MVVLLIVIGVVVFVAIVGGMCVRVLSCLLLGRTVTCDCVRAISCLVVVCWFMSLRFVMR